ncbi:MAG: o-succinylbenzoate synthase [Anaerolineae bacterium]
MKSITISKITLHPVALEFVERLRTSFGDDPYKVAILVQLETSEGVTGWGECSLEVTPGYGYETMGTGMHILRECLVPQLEGKTLQAPTEVPALLGHTRGHPFTKHGLETAVWDAWARTNGLHLADAFAHFLPEGNTPRGYATVGVSIGIKPSVEATLDTIRLRMSQGYKRIKLKIEPGWDVELARGVRAALPDILLMLDANSAYSLADAEHLKQLDAFNLLMIEQPLGYHDIYEHSKLQPQLKTPICLDESIHSADDLRLALALGACRILNLKPGRVSGFSESLEIYKVCVENKLPLWIGGMLETGVGRAAHLAFASLPGVTLPCDISATDRYFNPDIVEPAFAIRPDSTIAVAPAWAAVRCRWTG